MKDRELSDDSVLGAALGVLVETPFRVLTHSTIANVLGVCESDLASQSTIGESPVIWLAQRIRDDLEGVVEAVVGVDDPREAMKVLLAGLEQRLRDRPGLCVFLFPQALPDDARSHGAVRLLGSMLQGLTLALCRQLAEDHRLRSPWQPEAASLLVLAIVASSATRSGAGDPGSAFGLWWSAVGNESAAGDSPVLVNEPIEPPTLALQRFVELDLGPLLKSGQDPLETVLDTVSQLELSGVLKLKVPFRPNPLLTLLAKHGHGVVVFEETQGIWQVEVVRGGKPEVVDLRELEAPEPLQRVLEEASVLQGAEVFLARLPKFPALLIPHLNQRGLAHHLYDEADGSVFLRVWRAR